MQISSTIFFVKNPLRSDVATCALRVRHFMKQSQLVGLEVELVQVRSEDETRTWIGFDAACFRRWPL